MKTLLQIRSSMFGKDGVSSQLADHFVARWQRANPDGRVIERDLAEHELPHLDAARIGALSAPAAQRSAEQDAVLAQSDALIDELRAADVVVFAVPMYNFAIPTQLKSYFDHIARAQVTFRYTANGPEGLLPDRPTYVLATRGGYYQGTAADTQTPYVQNFLGFLGIRDLHFVYAEGLNLGAEQKQRAITAAKSEIDAIAA